MVVLHDRIVGSVNNSAVGDSQNEYVFTLTVSEDAKEIGEIVEFTDLSYALSYYVKLRSSGVGQ